MATGRLILKRTVGGFVVARRVGGGSAWGVGPSRSWEHADMMRPSGARQVWTARPLVPGPEC